MADPPAMRRTSLAFLRSSAGLVLLPTVFATGCPGDDTSQTGTNADSSSTSDSETDPSGSPTSNPTSNSESATESSSSDPTTLTMTDPSADSSSSTDPTAESSSTDPTAESSSTDPTAESSSSGGDTCGNDVIDGGEDCDGDDLGAADCTTIGGGFDGGTLACAADCAFDTSACFMMDCGNNTVEGNEICDGTDVPSDCVSEGFPLGGELGCLDNCSDFDTSPCVTSCVEEDIGGAVGPAVTSGNTMGDDNDLDASCGGAGGNDHVISFTAPEANTFTFDTFGSDYDSKLSLYGDCDQGSELACNDDAGGTAQSVVVLDMSAGQTVLIVVDGFNGAIGNWILNISSPVCGDDLAGNGETCDGVDLVGADCTTFGFDGGALACLDDCSDYDTSACTTCGNDILEAGEACDLLDLNGVTCGDLGFPGGTPTCAADCSGVTSVGCLGQVTQQFCSQPGTAILDNQTVSTDIVVAGLSGAVTDVNVSVNITHTWVSDMNTDVQHVPTAQGSNLFSGQCGSGDNVAANFDQGGAGFACSGGNPAISGTMAPEAPGNLDTLAAAVGDGNGTWRLSIADIAGGDQGTVNEWCVEITTQSVGQQFNYAFVSSQMVSGNMGGLAGADATCQGLADGAGLPGTYMAWLSTAGASPASRFTQSALPYQLVDGTVIANDWTDLIDGSILSAIDLTESGGPTPIGDTSCAGGGFPTVWSATLSNGSSGGSTCGDWTSTNGGGQWGLGSATDATWTSWCSGGICSWVSPIYCFQQDN